MACDMACRRWVKYPWALVLIILGGLIIVSWLCWYMFFGGGKRSGLVQHYFNMRKRVKGEPLGGQVRLIRLVRLASFVRSVSGSSDPGQGVSPGPVEQRGRAAWRPGAPVWEGAATGTVGQGPETRTRGRLCGAVCPRRTHASKGCAGEGGGCVRMHAGCGVGSDRTDGCLLHLLLPVFVHVGAGDAGGDGH